MNKAVTNKQQEANISQHNITFKSYEGIVPNPEMLEKYKKIDPRFNDMFLTQANNFLEMRIANEKIIAQESIKTISLSLFYAFASIFCLCGLGAYGFYLGYATQVSVIITGTLASLAGVFLLKNRVQKK